MDEELAQLLKGLTDKLAGMTDQPGLPQVGAAVAGRYDKFANLFNRAADGLEETDARSADAIRRTVPSASASQAGTPPKPGPQEPFLKIFPELRGINPGFKTGEWGFRHNCQSCAVAVDQRLARRNVMAMAVRRPKPPATDWRWPDDLLKAIGTRNRFQPVSGFPEIERTLLSAGPEARGIIYGVRRDADGKLVATHTFNVVNRKRRVFYVDGQHGGWANTDGYAELHLLRTN